MTLLFYLLVYILFSGEKGNYKTSDDRDKYVLNCNTCFGNLTSLVNVAKLVNLVQLVCLPDIVWCVCGLVFFWCVCFLYFFYWCVCGLVFCVFLLVCLWVCFLCFFIGVFVGGFSSALLLRGQLSHCLITHLPAALPTLPP